MLLDVTPLTLILSTTLTLTLTLPVTREDIMQLRMKQ
jgi:hypothetical protein